MYTCIYIKTALLNQVIILTFVDLIVCKSLMCEVYLVNKNLRHVTQETLLVSSELEIDQDSKIDTQDMVIIERKSVF